jgi:DNA-binding transcriptional regulator YhcF (GntR family)
MSDDELFTRRQLALRLMCDRETITRALADVPPDGVVRARTGTYPGYRLATAQRALRRRRGIPDVADMDLDLDLSFGAIAELLQ